jgi:beta-barrel assembly-enhancing protease
MRAARLVLGLALLALARPSGAAEIRLPEMGDSSSAVVSLEEEQRIGAAFMREVRRSMPVMDDAETTAYLNSIGNRIATHSNDAGRRFAFFLVAAPSINAFAGPGGYIGFHSGLVSNAQTEAELASVLAHEVAHVTQRHLPRSLEQSRRLSMPTLAAVLGSIILGAYNPEAGAAAITAVQAGTLQAQIDFTRANEQEADRIGMQTLVAAGYDPNAMPRFFERLQQATRLSAGADFPDFLRTHPVTLDRIAEARDRAARLPRREYPPSVSFPFFQARVRVISATTPQDALAYFSARLEGGQAQTPDAERYGLALALMRLGRTDEARQLLAPIGARMPEFLPLRTAAVELELAAQRPERAAALARSALEVFPQDVALTPLLAQALLRQGNAREARLALADQVARHGGSPRTYDLLAEVMAADGNAPEAYQMRAEYHVEQGRLETAIEQLRRAAKLEPITFAQISRIEARMRQLEEELEFTRKYFGPRRP